jgi:5'-nucleotidase
MLNVNVPADATADSPTVVTKLGRRYYGKIVDEKVDPRKKSYYWIGGSELGFDDIPGSDCNAVARDLVSISPVSMDLTCYRTLREVREWSGLQPRAEGE